MPDKKTWLATITATLLPCAAALGQTPPSAAAPRPDPADARAATAPLLHHSTFASYRRQGAELSPLPWRDANDAVERIGGWRAYAREAQVPTAPAAPVAAPARAR